MWNPIQEEIGNIDGPIQKLPTAARKKEKLQQQLLQPQQCEHQEANPVSHFDNNDNTVRMQRKVNKSGVKAMAAACLVLLLLITMMTFTGSSDCDDNPCGSHGTCRYWTVQRYLDESSSLRSPPLLFVGFVSPLHLFARVSPSFALVLSVPASNLHVSMSRVHMLISVRACV